MTERILRQTDDDLIRFGLYEAHQRGEQIADTIARIIASQWHGGQASALYSFASSGAIDRTGIETEVRRDMEEQLDPQDRLALWGLLGYVLHAHGTDDEGNRGPVPDWHESTRWGDV